MANRILIIFLTLYSVLLLININNIPLFVGDERRYWESVQSLMDGHTDTNNHPLLAKTIWLLTVNMFYIFTGTDIPLFWRLGTIIFSLLTLVTFYKIGRYFFKPGLALLAVTLLALDPMFFAFSRILQLEVVNLFFILLSLYLFLNYIKTGDIKNIYRGFFVLGLSMAVKFAALPLLLVVAFFLFYRNRNFSKRAVLFNTIFISLLFVLTGYVSGNLLFFLQSGTITEFLSYSVMLLKEQFGIYHNPDLFQVSSAFSWFIKPQILSLYRFDYISHVEAIYAFQSPTTFITSALTLVAAVCLVVKRKLKDAKKTLLILIYIFCLIVPWFINLRSTYYYYILPVIPLIILLFIKLVLMTGFSKVILKLFVILNIIIFSVYYPLLIGIKVPKKYDLILFGYNRQVYPPINKLFCQNCYPRK